MNTNWIQYLELVTAVIKSKNNVNFDWNSTKYYIIINTVTWFVFLYLSI